MVLPTLWALQSWALCSGLANNPSYLLYCCQGIHQKVCLTDGFLPGYDAILPYFLTVNII